MNVMDMTQKFERLWRVKLFHKAIREFKVGWQKESATNKCDFRSISWQKQGASGSLSRRTPSVFHKIVVP